MHRNAAWEEWEAKPPSYYSYSASLCYYSPLSNPRQRSSTARFSGYSAITILDQMILYWVGGHAVPCKLFRCIPASTH